MHYPPHALAYLTPRCGEKQAKRAGIVYLTEEETERIVGLPADGEPSDGLGIERSGEWVVRFLRDGAKPKFKQQADTTNTFYEGPFPDGTRWSKVRKDIRVALYIVEGWIKANALLADCIWAIGLNGIYGWMANKEPIDDFENFVWKGRRVILCFDSDVLQKSQVRQALARLAKHLKSLGARVRIKLLKPTKSGANVGPDDYVHRHGAAKFLKLATYPLTAPQFFDWDAPLVIQELNQSLGFLLHDGRAVILRTEPDPNYPGTYKMALSRRHDIEQKYANAYYTVKNADGSKSKRPKFPFWMTHSARREIRRILLNPELPPGYDPKTKDFNLWQGWSVVPHKPDETHSWDLMKRHILEVIANGNEEYAAYITKTIAFWVQHPATVPEVAPVLIGGEGTGKGMLWRTVMRLFGRHGIHLTTRRQLTGDFNEHLKDKLFIFADEALFAGDRQTIGVLYAMITEPTVVIEAKFQNLVMLANYRKIPMATNENWAVPAGLDARRFAVFRTNDTHKQDHAYFAAIDKELAHGGLEAMFYDLLHMDIEGFDPRKIPRTAALFEQKRFAFDDTTRWWWNRLLVGEPWKQAESTEQVHSEVASTTTNPYAKHSLETAIGVQLKKLCPAMRKKRQQGQRKRLMYYYFPDLTKCRKAFEKALQQKIDWDTGDAKE
jgi:hypothetical protein